MPTPKLQTSRALNVIPSDTVPIPNPFPITSGTSEAPLFSYTLFDSTKDFFALNVKAGDVVYNVTTNSSSIVILDPVNYSPTAASELALNDDIFPSAGDSYVIYQNSPLSGEPNAGCVLYVGIGGDVEIVTAGDDTVIMIQVPSGTFIPINVLQVKATNTSASGIIALW